MARFITPSQLSQRSSFYYQLGNYVSAGIPLIAGLEAILNNPPARSYITPVSQIIDRLKNGCTLAEATQAYPQWMPEFDIALLTAGEQSGRLDQVLKMLASSYGDRATLYKRVISRLMYPVLLLHMAIFIFPTSALAGLFLEGNIGPFFSTKLALLLPGYAAVAVLILISQSTHGFRWRAVLERIASMVPLLASARKSMALARVSAALEALISAGVNIIDAWRISAAASGSPALESEVVQFLPRVEQGETPAEVLQRTRYFPELFKSMYSSGELTGKLDQDLKYLHRFFSEEAFRKYDALADWTPKLVYLLIVLAIGWSIIKFWGGYFAEINKVIQ